MAGPAPTGVARTFADDELIVSKTDARGVITYANDVFLRVSGYDENAVIGKPHNRVRHPDSPRGLFKLLWDQIGAGKEVFAYINNLAKNGDHYWVLAHVSPSHDATGRITGYHSNRRVPAPHAIKEISALYAQMRNAERGHGNAKQAAAASFDAAAAVLSDRAVTYDEYVWSLINRSARQAA